MNNIYQRLIIALLILVGGWLVFQFPVPTVQIGDATLRIEVVDTPELQEKGLSERTSLEKNQGMLFVFEKPGRYGFWMKDMNFALDIIWVGQDKKIVEIMRNIDPETFPQAFYPKGLVQYVLEVNAGWAEQHGIMAEDVVRF